METISGKLTKDGIKLENGHLLIIETIKKAETGRKKYYTAKGHARKQRGKKLFSFMIKPWGEVLTIM